MSETIDEKILLKQRFLNGSIPDQNDFAALIEAFVTYKNLSSVQNIIVEQSQKYDAYIEANDINLANIIKQISTPSYFTFKIGADIKIDDAFTVKLESTTRRFPSVTIYKVYDGLLEYNSKLVKNFDIVYNTKLSTLEITISVNNDLIDGDTIIISVF